MKTFVTGLPLLAVVVLLGCDANSQMAAVDDGGGVEVAAKGVERVTYSVPWTLPDLYVPCLDQTVSFTGYANFTGAFLVTPSGNYVDMAMFDGNTDDPYVMVLPDGSRWPLKHAEDNSLILEKARGNDPGSVTAQANMVFFSEDGKSHVKYRAHYIAEGLNWDTGELIGIQRLDDIWTCHLAK